MLPRIPKYILYLVVIVAPFLLLFFNSSFWHGLKLRTMGVAASAVSVVNAPLEEVRILLSYRQTWFDHRKLEEQSAPLRAKSAQFDEMVAENKRLRSLLGLKGRQAFSTVAAHVIMRDPASWNSSLMINKGRAHGLVAGMPVVNVLGVAGKVAEVAENAAKVILVNDPGFSLAVVDQRTREAALLSGSLSGECRLSYLSAGSDIKVGDEIVTSSFSAAFPAGLIVGTVTEVFAAGGISDARAKVRPAVDVARIEELLVVK
jgi:rod shape-determining protein MreC